jgi:hypothetical protein
MSDIKELINKQFRNETETGAKLGLDDKYINAFKEYLVQQRQEAHNKHPKLSAMVAIDVIFDELLESLSNVDEPTEDKK